MFENQRPDEKILFVIRKHYFFLFWSALRFLVLFLFIILAFLYYKVSSPFFWTFLAWLFLGVFWGLRDFYCWKKSQYILTNQRLIKIEQKGLFQKNVSEASLDKIQNVSHKIKGFWATFLEFGTVYGETSSQEKIGLEMIAEPEEVSDLILKATEGEVKEKKEEKKASEIDSDFWGN